MINKKLSQSDFENFPLSDCDPTVVSDFLKSINNATLGNKVASAINHRKQGHFNKAMLNMTEANRDQVIAIRKIQAILDEINGRDKTEVILEKFRQQYPFQMGLVNGEEVLNLLKQIKSVLGDEFPQMQNELYQNEEKLSSLHEELNFIEERIQGKISEHELDVLNENISSLSEKISSTKIFLISNLDIFIRQKFSSVRPNHLIILIQNFYLILTSSIEILDAKQVDI